jgi:hypothetical protein
LSDGAGSAATSGRNNFLISKIGQNVFGQNVFGQNVFGQNVFGQIYKLIAGQNFIKNSFKNLTLMGEIA